MFFLITMITGGCEKELICGESKNKGIITLISIALGCIFVVFLVPFWHSAYIRGGNSLFIAMISCITIPLFGTAIDYKNPKRGFMIASYTLAGIYLAASIIIVIMAVVQG